MGGWVSAAEPQWTYDTKNTITSLVISGDGNRIGVSTTNNNFLNFDRNGSLLWTNQSIQKISSVSMPANSQYVAVGGTSLAIFRSNGEPLSKLNLGQPIRDMQFFPNGNYIAVMDSEKISLFTRSGEGLWIYSILGEIQERDNLDYHHHIGVPDDGSMVIFAPPWAKKIYCLNTGGNYMWVTPIDGFPLTMATSPGGNYVLVGTNNNTLSLITTQGKIQWVKNLSEPVTSISSSYDGSYIVFGGKENVVSFVKDDGSFQWKKDLFSQIDAVAVTNTGGRIIAGTENKILRVFKSSGDELWEYSLSGRIRDIQISDDGQYFVIGTDDGKILFFSMEGLPAPVAVPDPIRSVITTTTIPTPTPTQNVTPVPAVPVTPELQGKTDQFPVMFIGIFLIFLILVVGAGSLYYLRKRDENRDPGFKGRGYPRSSPPASPSSSAMDTGTGERNTGRDSNLIFICAKSEDDKYAYSVYSFLIKKGYNVFFSKETLREMGKAEFGEEIDAALEKAKHFIVVTSSKENIRSKWVMSECRIFLDEKRAGRKPGNIIVLIAGSTRIEDLPISLRSFETRWLDDPDTLDEILNYLS